MRESLLVVIRFSPALGEIGRQLGEALGTEVHVLSPGDVRAIPRATAVLLNAGGCEREAIEWLESRAPCPGVPVFVAGTDPGRRIASRTVSQGATDYFTLPDDLELLHSALTSAFTRQRMDGELPQVKRHDHAALFPELIGESAPFRAVLQRAAHLLQHPLSTVLILGETGTGKELLARAIHAAGPRRDAPFVLVNCAALPRELVESELFGHEKGAFPEAFASQPGLFEVAEGGTLLLDEIEALPGEAQARLLDVLERREVCRMGASRPRPLDVRVMVSSHADLGGAVRRGVLREDLYQRLSAVTLELPPLRDRDGDVLLIADRLVASLAGLHGLPAPELRGDVLGALREYSWPGNVRELKNALERALLLSPVGTLSVPELLPRPARSWTGALPFPARLDDITTAAARATLEACGGNVSAAARQLRVSRGRLRRLIRPSLQGSQAIAERTLR